MRRAFIAAITGIDGSGKTSVIDELRKSDEFAEAVFLLKRHRDNVHRLIRLWPERGADPNAQLAGTFAEVTRWAHAFDFLKFYEEEVLPQLESASLVISDRWTICSTAYAEAGTQLGSSIQSLLDVCVPADLLVYLEVDPRIARARIAKRGTLAADEELPVLEAYRDAYQRLLPDAPSPVVRLRNDDFGNTVKRTAEAILSAHRDRQASLQAGAARRSGKAHSTERRTV